MKISRKNKVIAIIIIYFAFGLLLYINKNIQTIQRIEHNSELVDSVDCSTMISQKFPIDTGKLKKLVLYVCSFDVNPEGLLNVYIAKSPNSLEKSNIVAKKTYKCSDLSPLSTIEIDFDSPLSNCFIIEYTAPDGYGYVNFYFADNYHGAYRGEYIRNRSLSYCAEIETNSEYFKIWRTITLFGLFVALILFAAKKSSFWGEKIRKYEVIISAIVCTFFSYIILGLFTAMVYYTNDDSGIQYTLSMAEKGDLWWINQFIGAWLSIFIGQLYIYIKGVQWWYIFHHIMIIIGLTSFNYSLFYIGKEKKYDKTKCWLLVILLDAVLFWGFIATVAFTCTPAILCSGLILLILLRKDKELTSKNGMFFIFLIAVGYSLALMMRVESGIVMLPFVLLAYLMTCTNLGRNITVKSILHFVLILTIYVTISAVLIITSNNLIKKVNGDEFCVFNDSRIKYTDYGRDTYDENPQIYEDINWDESIAKLDGFTFLCDEKTPENLDYISDNSKSSKFSGSFLEKLRASVKSTINDKWMLSLLIISVFFSVTAMVSIIKNTTDKREYLLWWILNNFGGAAIAFYIMGIVGRWPYRVEYTVFTPVNIINVYIILELGGFCLKGISLNIMNKEESIFALTLVEVLFTVCLLSILCYELPELYTNGKKLKSSEKVSLIVQDYMNEHPDNIYINQIIDVYVTSWKTPKSTYVNNTICEGGSFWKGASWQHFCDIHGLKQGITPEIYKNDNVFARGYINNNYLKYMMTHHNALGVAVVDSIDEMNDIEGYDNPPLLIMHYVFEENAEQYKSYYTIVDDELVIKSEEGQILTMD